jgi:PAS domain S-box-containing protein
MSYAFTVYSIIFLVATLLSFFVAFIAWQRRTVKGAKDLSIFMISAGVWAFCVIFETAATTSALKVFWEKLIFIGAVSAPVLYLIFVFRITGREKFISRQNIVLVSVIPATALLAALTNNYHKLFWTGFSSISTKTNIMEYYHGIWFWIGHMAYNSILMVLATTSLFVFIVRHSNSYRKQGLLILFASLCPWIAGVLYVTGINLFPGLKITPLFVILGGAIFAYALLFTRLIYLVAVSRETLVETMQDGIIVLDEENRIQDINGAALSFLGINNKNIIGLPAKSSGATTELLLNALLAKDPEDQIEIQTHSQTRIFRINKRNIKNHSGSRLLIIRDITDWVSRQIQIQQGEERYRKLFTMFRLMADNMQDMLWAKDLNNNYIFANKAMCEKLLQATDTEEPIGKSDLFFAERERRKFPERTDWHTFGELCRDSDTIVTNSRKQEHFDEFGNVNGEFLFLDVRKAPIFDENGVMIGVVGNGRDITLQKKEESEIRRRDVLLEAIAKATARLVQGENLVANINEALEIIGKATEANRVYIFWNHFDPDYKLPLMSQSFEWTDGTVKPQIDNPYLQSLPYEIECPRWYALLSSGKVVKGNIKDFPEQEKTSLGAKGIKSLIAIPVMIDNSFWGFIGFDDCGKERSWSHIEETLLSAAANSIGAAYLRKISQEELLAAKDKAEESDRLKSAFLANMSHEIRTPMNGILGFSDLLKNHNLTGEQQQKYIAIIEKSGARMLNIINDIVDISKIESGQVDVSISETNINEQLDFIYAFFKTESDRKGLNLTFKTGLPLKTAIISTDREKIYAILTNLVKNAIKYTNKGSIEFGYEQIGNFMKFYVKDTGIGVALDRQKAIFDRFVQADIADKNALQGAGLGLSIAKAYVEILGGKIWLESEPGEGSVFYFAIPHNNEVNDINTSQNSTSENTKNDQLKNLKILIAEDEETSDLLLTFALEKISREILHAKTGVEAVEICRSNPDIDLILMDIKMPEIDGYRASTLIRHFNKDVPIIAQTAYGLSGDREKAIESGCTDYLSKPVKNDELIRLISKHLYK